MSKQKTYLILACAAIFAANSMASDWSGGGGNWSSNGSPGWNGTGVPDATGATANFTTFGNTGFGVTLDQAVTIGTLSYSGSGNGSLSFTLSNALTLNNGGSGAVMSNTSTGTGSRISFGTGSIVMADNLTISNTNSNITGTQSITTGSSTVFSGSGNLTLSNVMNDISNSNTSNGIISLGANNTFIGNVLIQKGAVALANNTGLGNASNAVTLGSAGNGSASLITSGSVTNFANNVTVAAGTGGTLLIGSGHTGTTVSTFSGNITLNDNATLSSVKGAGGNLRFTNTISGVGGVTTAGTGLISLAGSNTYSGNTVLSGGALTLEDNASLRFVIGASGSNNSISGTSNQTLTLDGDFVFDLSGAAASGSWTIVDIGTLNETFSSTFTVSGWVDAGSNTWTFGNYTFSETTGMLTAVPEPSTWLMFVAGCGVLMACRRRKK